MNREFISNRHLKKEDIKKPKVNSRPITNPRNSSSNSSSSSNNNPTYNSVTNDDEHLKEKFNSYVDYVKHLEKKVADLKAENNSLVQSSQEEMIKLTETYDDKIAQLRQLIEFETTEKVEKRFEQEFNNLRKVQAELELKNEKLVTEIVELTKENKEYKKTVRQDVEHEKALCAQISKLEQELARVGYDNESEVRLLKNEKESLRSDLKEKINENVRLMEESVVKERELRSFRALLDEENRRCVKKRKVDDVRDNYIEDGSSCKRSRSDYMINAITNGNIKLACENDFTGKYIWLMNITDSDIDLNEWHLTFEETGSGAEPVEYVFAPRILMAKQKLKVWNCAETMTENDTNLRLNIEIPKYDRLTCKLTNDMYEIEAAFDVRRDSSKEEKCNLM